MPQFVRSELTARLVRYLAALPKGTLATYDELGQSVGEPISARMHHLRSARAILVAEHRQLWSARPRIGLRRLTDQEIAEKVLPWHLRGARHKLGRGVARSSVAEMSELTPALQQKHAMHNVQAELALQALSRATAARLAKTAQGNSNDLPAFNLVEWAITLMPGRKGVTIK
jgi:hypothetical protein